MRLICKTKNLMGSFNLLFIIACQQFEYDYKNKVQYHRSNKVLIECENLIPIPSKPRCQKGKENKIIKNALGIKNPPVGSGYKKR